MALAGCTSSASLLSQTINANQLPESVELDATPFFPQNDYQCAPAALATVLVDSGVDVVPESLVSRVYIPERRGSLQVELLAASRGLDRLPYVIQPELEALMAEIAGGRPVLVMQNLGYSFAPVWHYAVVVGYDGVKGQVILRSDTRERLLMSAARFVRTWAKAESWGMVALRPGELPTMTVESDYLEAAAALESVGRSEAAKETFRTAVRRWPESSAALFGFAGACYATGDLVQAEEAYRRILAESPANRPVMNNLAQVLADQGRCTDALDMIGRASADSNASTALDNTIAASRISIRQQCDATPEASTDDS